MSGKAEGRRVAILVADGFEESELFSPKQALEDSGASVEIVSLKRGEVQGFQHMEKSKSAPVDRTIDEVKAADYDALFIPGGLFNPDHLRGEEKVLAFVKDFFEQKKPVGAICHGPQVLMSAGVVQGRKMTAFKTVQPDLKYAGAQVSDEEVVVDEGLVTSRNPDDLPAFNKKLVEEICEGKHAQQAA